MSDITLSIDANSVPLVLDYQGNPVNIELVAVKDFDVRMLDCFTGPDLNLVLIECGVPLGVKAFSIIRTFEDRLDINNDPYLVYRYWIFKTN